MNIERIVGSSKYYIIDISSDDCQISVKITPKEGNREEITVRVSMERLTMMIGGLLDDLTSVVSTNENVLKDPKQIKDQRKVYWSRLMKTLGVRNRRDLAKMLGVKASEIYNLARTQRSASPTLIRMLQLVAPELGCHSLQSSA